MVPTVHTVHTYPYTNAEQYIRCNAFYLFRLQAVHLATVAAVYGSLPSGASSSAALMFYELYLYFSVCPAGKCS
jgi:hypothetical protein